MSSAPKTPDAPTTKNFLPVSSIALTTHRASSLFRDFNIDSVPGENLKSSYALLLMAVLALTGCSNTTEFASDGSSLCLLGTMGQRVTAGRVGLRNGGHLLSAADKGPISWFGVFHRRSGPNAVASETALEKTGVLFRSPSH